MKKILFCLLGMTYLISTYGQLKTTTLCPAFNVDLLDGKVNELPANATNGEIKGKFPCFTSSEEEAASSTCGGLVAYKDKDIYFYTGRDYVEIGEKFKGKLSVPLMGAARNGLFKTLGHPRIKDLNWDAYQTAYGTLILYFRANKVYKIQFSTKKTDEIKLCE